MKENITYGLWAFFYILCVVLGFAGKTATVLALLFFVPGVLLLYWGCRKQVRLIAAISLGLTFLALIANFASIGLSEGMGNFLYGVLVLVSSPMVCSGYWVLSLFLWACLIMGSFLKKKN